jgi:hypothetical protein
MRLDEHADLSLAEDDAANIGGGREVEAVGKTATKAVTATLSSSALQAMREHNLDTAVRRVVTQKDANQRPFMC